MNPLHSVKESDLFFGSLLESSLNKIFLQFSSFKKVIIVDENTHDHCLEYLITNYVELKDAEIIMLPAGEQNKVMEVCFQVWQALTEYEINRNDLIINLGGGLVTDMGGFIASIYKRGVKFINIPTSLLGMVDASVGGKTGIDLGSYKNQLGVFSFPEIVICDSGFLDSLPPEEFLSGKAEMLKHGLIADPEHWKKSLALTSENITNKDIERSVLIKKKIVEMDPFEKKERKALNFGHTVGHAIEGFLLEKNPQPHGFCVAWGIVVESFLSYRQNILSKEEFIEISVGIQTNYPKIPINESDVPNIIQLMRNDKKNNTESINFVLIKSIGNVEVNYTFSEDEVKSAILETLIN